MSTETINLNELAKELGLTRQALNFHIEKGRAGDIKKAGEGKTHQYLITVDNVLALINWLKMYGRGNKIKLVDAEEKYESISSSS